MHEKLVQKCVNDRSVFVVRLLIICKVSQLMADTAMAGSKECLVIIR